MSSVHFLKCFISNACAVVYNNFPLINESLVLYDIHAMTVKSKWNVKYSVLASGTLRVNIMF